MKYLCLSAMSLVVSATGIAVVLVASCLLFVTPRVTLAGGESDPECSGACDWFNLICFSTEAPPNNCRGGGLGVSCACDEGDDDTDCFCGVSDIAK